MIKIIIDKLKFAQFQEDIVLEQLHDILQKDFEENELRELVQDLNKFSSDSQFIRNFEANFYDGHAEITYHTNGQYEEVNFEHDVNQNLFHYEDNFENDPYFNNDLYLQNTSDPETD